MNTATKIVYEWLADNYSMMSGSIDEKGEDWIDTKGFAEEECEHWLEGEYQMDDDSDEMYPPWVPLVVTPAISDTIDWALIQKTICETYDNEG